MNRNFLGQGGREPRWGRERSIKCEGHSKCERTCPQARRYVVKEGTFINLCLGSYSRRLEEPKMRVKVEMGADPVCLL